MTTLGNLKSKEVRAYRGVLSDWKRFIKMRAALLAISFLHNSREVLAHGGRKGDL